MNKNLIEVVILAAGVGSRLRPLTDNLPKCMIEVNNEKLIERVLKQMLVHDSIDQIYVLTGHEHTRLEKYLNDQFPEVNCIYNEDYKNTNNMFSLNMYLEKRNTKSDLIIINADCIYDSEIVKECVEFEGSCIMTDSSVFLEESMKVKISGNSICEISKKINKGSEVMTSIDLYKFKKDTAKEISDIVSDYMVNEDVNQWTEVAINDLVKKNNTIFANDISGSKWFEIDDVDDLNTARKLFLMIKALVLDLDGTVYVDGNPIKNIVELLCKYNEAGGYVQFLTNNTSVSKTKYVEKLRKLGLSFVDEKLVLSPIDAFIEFAKQNKVKSCYYLLPKEVINYIEENNGPRMDIKKPEFVLVGFDKEVTYQKLQKACEFINSGIKYYITHIDLACPSNEGPIPDCGSLAGLIQSTTGKNWVTDFGKPSLMLGNMIGRKLDELSIKPENAVLVGDRYYTDIVLGNSIGLKTCHVKTGEVYRLKAEDPDSYVPTFEYSDISVFIEKEVFRK